MADIYIVNNSDLTAVANAIRTKTGTTDQLTFPAGFTTAIGNIQNAPATYIEETYNEDGDLTSAIVHGCMKIRQSVFRYSSYLTQVTIPDTITIIDSNAFQGCLVFNIEKLPDGLTELGLMAFYGCRSLTLANLPAGMKTISSEAFSQCQKLALTTFPAALTSIGTQAFYNCTGLTSLTFQGTPIEIAADAFEGCTNLTTINVPWAEGAVANAPWGATNATISYNYTG